MLGGYEYLEFASLLLKQFRIASPLQRQVQDALIDLTQPYLLQRLTLDAETLGPALAAGEVQPREAAAARASLLTKLRRWMWQVR